MLIAQGSLTRQSLARQTAIITGAGGGIGYEAARSLIWLGARVVIAEIDKNSGQQAAQRLNHEFGAGRAIFVRTDVGDEGSIRHLAQQSARSLGTVDIVINNATVAPLGAVSAVSISDWDASYRVNLRGPALLARAFVPGMVERKHGVFVCVSSTGADYMGAYESVKAAQVHLGATLDREVHESNVSAFTIGPGFVPTKTASAAIPKLAVLMGQPVAEMQALLAPFTISVEAAGAGFAAAVALAERYRGQEISSQQALIDAGIDVVPTGEAAGGRMLTADQRAQALALCCRVRQTLAEQAAGWKQRSIFEQQWMIRMFRQKAEMPVDGWLKALDQIEGQLGGDGAQTMALPAVPLDALAHFYTQLYDLAKGYVKDAAQREVQLATVDGWRKDVLRLAESLHGG